MVARARHPPVRADLLVLAVAPDIAERLDELVFIELAAVVLVCRHECVAQQHHPRHVERRDGVKERHTSEYHGHVYGHMCM